jgi:hypothetical protein
MRSVLIGTVEQQYVPFEKMSSIPFAVPKPTLEGVTQAYRRLSGVVLCNRQTMEKLIAKSVLSRDPKTDPCKHHDECATPLHVAAAAGEEDVICELLEAGADPTAQDAQGRVPYDVCLSRGARRIFRFWREQNETRWDWSAAQVPGDNACRGTQENKSRKKKGKHNAKEHETASRDHMPSPKGKPNLDESPKPSKTQQDRSKGRIFVHSAPVVQKPQRHVTRAKTMPKPAAAPRQLHRLSVTRSLAN